jgi:serine/threonine-protein kinase
MSDLPDRPSDLSRIFDEFLVRRQLGESPILDEYCQRFPDLAEQLRQHVRLFDALGEAGSETDARGSMRGLLDLVAPELNAPKSAIDFVPDDPCVQQLLDELLASPAEPEEVCRSCPELLPQVRARWRAMCQARAELDAMCPPRRSSDSNAPAPPPEASLLPVIPGYEVEAVLGVGGMGVVFRARHLRLNRLVALKMTLAGAYAGPRERERFQREAEAVAALRHPNVVQIHDVGDSDGRPYFTMEYVEGGSLAQKLVGTPQPARQAAALMATLAAAVHAAHQGGIVHRDLKPANVLLTADGTPKVTDFGLARRVGGEAGLTRTGTAVGTPSYMAPEQARGESDGAGPVADLYALGAILYELLTGRPPFRAETAADTVHQLLTQDPVPPSRLNGKVPRDLETICLKCLRKEPRLRYATAAELADDLGRFQGGEAIAARPEGPLARMTRRLRRRPALSVAVAASTLFALALAGVGLWLIFDGAATGRAGDEDLRDTARRLQKSSWPEASAALQRARARLGGRASAGQRRLMDQADADLVLADRLDAIRLSLSDVVEGGIDYGRCDRTYEEALRGVAPAGVQDDAEAVADRVRISDIREALVAALDHWSSVARGQSRQEWILEVARRSDPDSDPDPTSWRNKARDPAVRADRIALARLIETAPVAEQPVPLLVALAAAPLPLTSGQRVSFLQRVQQSHPDDFWANLTLGYVLMLQNEPAEAIRYYQAAAAIRPLVAIGHYSIGMALLRLPRHDQSGRFAEAALHFRRAAEIDPGFALAHDHLAHSLTALGRHAEAIEAIRYVLDLDPDAPRAHARLGICLEAEARLAEAEAAHRRAFALDPADGEISKTLRAFLMRRCLPEEARAVWAKALETNPADHAPWYGYAELCLFLGHEDEYRRARRTLLAKFGASTDPFVAERTGRACLLVPGSGDELRGAAALAARATAADRARYGHVYPSFQFVKGLADYREGRFDQTIAAMKGDASRVPGPGPRLVLAMALHRQGKVEEARRQLADAVLSYDWRDTNVRDQDGCICHVLRREAERMIVPNLPAFLEGDHQPRDQHERDALLGVCQQMNRTLAVARLYAEAFAADPQRPWDLTGHRHRAACYAAQAGCGRGADAGGLDAEQRARWRAKAREWLRADLAAWRQALDSDPAGTRDVLRQRLSDWRRDSDLAGLRDRMELEKLSPDERKDSLALWDEVGVLLNRSQKVR